MIVALVLLILGVAPLRAQDDDDGYYAGDQADDQAYADPAPDAEALAPYGRWASDPDYGQVWIPQVAYGWRPYSDGSWEWSDYGWTWVSGEPWAWTFHYGRWFYRPLFGWCWLPGTAWGPAWVDWYYGDGFIGWAPLPPFATHVTIIQNFVFVHEHEFCSPRLATIVVGHRFLPDPVIRHWRSGHRPPPRVDRLAPVLRDAVRHVSGKPPGTVAPGGVPPGRRLGSPAPSQWVRHGDRLGPPRVVVPTPQVVRPIAPYPRVQPSPRFEVRQVPTGSRPVGVVVAPRVMPPTIIQRPPAPVPPGARRAQAPAPPPAFPAFRPEAPRQGVTRPAPEGARHAQGLVQPRVQPGTLRTLQ